MSEGQPRNVPAWRDLPPGPRSMPWPVFKIPLSGTSYLVVVSPRLVGVYVHWTGYRTLPCTEGELPCRWCDARLRRYWTGWLACQQERGPQTHLLCLPARSVWACPPLTAPEACLRGRGLLIGRTRNSPNGPVYVQASLSVVREEGLAPPPDVPSLLARMWDSPMRAAPSAPTAFDVVGGPEQ